ncbi:hypothetical protein MST22_06835 [Virgibacillus halodenitrificans]|jgi:hypothetical protein|nr:hypothetical protein [Virgibacillus halodenitrificans]
MRKEGVDMRMIALIFTFFTMVAVIYRWRYRILNTVLAISVLRKIAVNLSMNMPAIRSKILPNLFGPKIN